MTRGPDAAPGGPDLQRAAGHREGSEGWPPPPRRTLALTFAAAALLALAYVHWNRFDARPPAAEEAHVAYHVRHGHGFLSPMSAAADAPPTSWCPPIYPCLIAAAYALPSRAAALTFLALVNALAFGALAASLLLVAWLHAGRAAAACTAFLLAANPLILRFIGDWWDGMLALGLFWSCVAAASLLARRVPGRGAALGLGGALGALSLVNASYALAYPVVVLHAARRLHLRARLLWAATAFAAFAAVLAPWTARNWIRFGRVFYVRGGSGLELWSSNVPGADGWSGPGEVLRHPTYDAGERQALLTLGENAYFDSCARRFREEVAADPPAFLRRVAMRLRYMAFDRPWDCLDVPLLSRTDENGLFVDRAPFNAAVLLLALGGLLVAWRARLHVGALAACSLLAVAPFTVTYVSDRYVLPLRAGLALFGGIFLAAAWRRLRQGGPSRGSASEAGSVATGSSGPASPARESGTAPMSSNTTPE